MFCQENSLSTTKHPADHTSPCLLELYFYLFLRSCSEKPLLCKVRPPRSIPCPHTIHLVSTHLPSHAHLSTHLSIHPFYSLLALLICCPVIISPQRQSRVFYLNQPVSTLLTLIPSPDLLRKIRSRIFSPPAYATTRRPTFRPFSQPHLRFQQQRFDKDSYLYLKTTCNFLVSQGGRRFAASC